MVDELVAGVEINLKMFLENRNNYNTYLHVSYHFYIGGLFINETILQKFFLIFKIHINFSLRSAH